MLATRPRLSVVCDSCGALARLTLINAYPFTKGRTEATYRCAGCGAETKRALPAAERAARELAEAG